VTARQPQLFRVFGFGTTHDALIAEELLVARGFEVVPIPTPKVLGATCGIALRLPVSQGDGARELLLESQVQGVSEATIEDV